MDFESLKRLAPSLAGSITVGWVVPIMMSPTIATVKVSAWLLSKLAAMTVRVVKIVFLMSYCALLHTAYAYEAAAVIAIGRFADLHAILRAGMNEGEHLCDRIIIDHNTYMAHTATRTGTGEEHEVTGLHLAALHGGVACILITRRVADIYVALAIDVAGEARTVERIGTLAAKTVACTQVLISLVHEVIDHCSIVFERFFAIIEKVEVVDLLVCAHLIHIFNFAHCFFEG